jgi:hypothetical protein
MGPGFRRDDVRALISPRGEGAETSGNASIDLDLKEKKKTEET